MTQSEAAELTGVPQETISRWMRAGLLEADSPGRGGRTDLHMPDIRRILVFRELREAGATYHTVKAAVDKLRGRGFDDWQAELLAVTADGDVIWLDMSREAILRLSDTQSYIIDIAGLRDELRQKEGRLVELTGDSKAATA